MGFVLYPWIRAALILGREVFGKWWDAFARGVAGVSVCALMYFVKRIKPRIITSVCESMKGPAL